MACCRGPRCLGQWPLGVNAARDFFQPASARFPGGGPAPLCTEDGTLNERGETAQGLQAARERDATLRAAVLRIAVRLDLDTVLREVVDGARALTGARYGGITTVDGDGQPRDFVTSGFSPDEHRAMETWPDGLRLFRHLRELPAPLRLPDLDAWTRSFGCSPFTVSSGAFQATPMRHRRPAVAPSRRRRCATGGRRPAASSSAARRAGLPTRTRGCWCSSPSRPRRRSPTPARTARSNGPGRISRRWSRPARWAWWCSTPQRAAVAQRGGAAHRGGAGHVGRLRRIAA